MTSVLLIEDNKADARLIQELLRETAYTQWDVTIVERLAEGLEVLGQHPYDVVLLDLSLPDSQGLATVQQFTHANDTVPCVVLTGYSSEEQGMAAVNLGAQDYLMKNAIDTDVLVRTLHYAIQRKQSQWAQMELKKEQQIRQLKENFLETVSHEFRTPLTEIISSAELIELKAHTISEETLMKHLQRILRSAQHMNAMLDNITTFSLMISGQWELMGQLMDIPEFISDIVKHYQTQTDRDRITVSHAGECSHLTIDARILMLITQNLVGNALAHAGPEARIHVDAICKVNYIELHVTDNGHGIAPEKHAKLFELVQGGGRNNVDPGIGIGLNIVRLAAELHDGNVTLESALGQGTRVSVTLRALPL